MFKEQEIVANLFGMTGNSTEPVGGRKERRDGKVCVSALSVWRTAQEKWDKETDGGEEPASGESLYLEQLHADFVVRF